jgi:hypothetical protein
MDDPDWLDQLYRRIDRRVAELTERHGDRLNCRSGCRSCCEDGLTVFEVEAEGIRRHCAELLQSEEPGLKGACAFLDHQGQCRIYRYRPYVCRTQGLPLRWLEEGLGGQLKELRDICPLNEEGDPVETLPAGDCWTIGPIEAELAQRQDVLVEGKPRRVELRSLFCGENK